MKTCIGLLSLLVLLLLAPCAPVAMVRADEVKKPDAQQRSQPPALPQEVSKIEQDRPPQDVMIKQGGQLVPIWKGTLIKIKAIPPAESPPEPKAK